MLSLFYADVILLVFYFFQKADLAVCDLTITYDRRRAVDFTMPFMTLGKKFKDRADYVEWRMAQDLVAYYTYS